MDRTSCISLAQRNICKKKFPIWSLNLKLHIISTSLIVSETHLYIIQNTKYESFHKLTFSMQYTFSRNILYTKYVVSAVISLAYSDTITGLGSSQSRRHVERFVPFLRHLLVSIFPLRSVNCRSSILKWRFFIAI